MNIVYLFLVDTSLSSGKNRATRQKIAALKTNFYKVEVFTLDRYWKWAPFFYRFVVVLKSLAYIFKNKNDVDVLVTRGGASLLAVFFCKLVNIKTYREVHADIVDEVPYLNKNKFDKFLILILSVKSYLIDKVSDVRIFNNPALKSYYMTRGLGKESDVCVYNGASRDAIVNISKENAREKFGLVPGYKYLIFTGSASFWHGVHYLVRLQECFDLHDDKIKIVCAGGRVASELDPDKRLINISPLGDVGCCEIIKAGDACLLPVNNVRVSPGSPLKLYDYMINSVPVISQDNMLGYSDEVERFSAGIVVDFLNSSSARASIIDFLADQKSLSHCSYMEEVNSEQYLWEKRVVSWFSE